MMTKEQKTAYYGTCEGAFSTSVPWLRYRIELYERLMSAPTLERPSMAKTPIEIDYRMSIPMSDDDKAMAIARLWRMIRRYELEVTGVRTQRRPLDVSQATMRACLAMPEVRENVRCKDPKVRHLDIKAPVAVRAPSIVTATKVIAPVLRHMRRPGAQDLQAARNLLDRGMLPEFAFASGGIPVRPMVRVSKNPQFKDRVIITHDPETAARIRRHQMERTRQAEESTSTGQAMEGRLLLSEGMRQCMTRF